VTLFAAHAKLRHHEAARCVDVAVSRCYAGGPRVTVTAEYP
jgi:hypothetical protein